MHLIISGPPLSGKTTVAREAAKLMQIPVFDTDCVLKEIYQAGCPNLFQTLGEERFREAECHVLDQLLKETTPQIISLGGGVLTYPKSAELIKDNMIHIFLACSFSTLLHRLKQLERIPAYLDTNKIEESFRDIYQKRVEIYQKLPHFSVDVTDQTPLQSAVAIQEIYES